MSCWLNTKTVVLSPAYRAILAEPRSKNNSSEDYSAGGVRGGDYSSSDSMNQYPIVTRMHFKNTWNQAFEI